VRARRLLAAVSEAQWWKLVRVCRWCERLPPAFPARPVSRLMSEDQQVRRGRGWTPRRADDDAQRREDRCGFFGKRVRGQLPTGARVSAVGQVEHGEVVDVIGELGRRTRGSAFGRGVKKLEWAELVDLLSQPSLPPRARNPVPAAVATESRGEGSCSTARPTCAPWPRKVEREGRHVVGRGS